MTGGTEHEVLEDKDTPCGNSERLEQLVIQVA